MRMLGFNLFTSCFGVYVIHILLGYATSNKWYPNPWFNINLNRIHQGSHGSDSQVLDRLGRFIPAKFEEIFTVSSNIVKATESNSE